MADRRVIMVGERHALRAFHSAYRGNRPVVFDIGANVGDYIGELLAHFPAANVYAFEPQPEAMTELRDRFPWVQSEGYVVGDIAEGTATLWRDQAKSYHASVHRRSDPAIGIFKYTLTAPCCRLDRYCQDNGIKHIDLLKIDVEGHELSVLIGAGDLLGSGIDVVQFEFGPHATLAGYSFIDLYDCLHERGYHLYRQYPDMLESIPMYDSKVDEVTEPVRNYLAVSRHAQWWWYDNA